MEGISGGSSVTEGAEREVTEGAEREEDESAESDLARRKRMHKRETAAEDEQRKLTSGESKREDLPSNLTER